MGCEKRSQKQHPQPSASTARVALRRTCACGQHTGGDECPACKSRRDSLSWQGLKVSSPGDILENEADRMADQAMAGPGGRVLPRSPGAPNAPHTEKGGSPLEPGARTFLESRFGADFSTVRVHTDGEAAQASRSLNAEAFTLGNGIFFARGSYNPHTPAGKHLLAHELAHVLQQRSQPSPRTIQRKISVKDSSITPPHLKKSQMTPQQQKENLELVDKKAGEVAELLLNKLCPEGQWSVDAGGEVKPGTRVCTDDSLMAAHKTSCSCLCELMGPLDLTLRITDRELEKHTGYLLENRMPEDAGEGMATASEAPLNERRFHAAVSGLATTIAGVGDPSVPADRHGHQQLRDPAWIILGHEICGHVRRNLSRPSPLRFTHTMSEDYDSSAVDLENAIRREHSTPSDNYGIRFGDFKDPAGNIHSGSVYMVKNAVSARDLERQLNIPHAMMKSPKNVEGMTESIFVNCTGKKFDPHRPQTVHKHIFPHRGSEPVTFLFEECTDHLFKTGEKLFLEGVFAHRVIAGETKLTVAKMWNVSPAALSAANLHISLLDQLEVDKPLPIGMIVLIPYDRKAGKTFFKP